MFKKKKPSVNYLAQVPLRKEMEFTDTDGKITLLFPKFKNFKYSKWLIPRGKTTHIKFLLDETGSQIWRLINGQKPVGEICIDIKLYLSDQGKPVDHVEERVTSFLTVLSKNGFISFNEVQPQLNE
jgi:hypothetical protein